MFFSRLCFCAGRMALSSLGALEEGVDGLKKGFLLRRWKGLDPLCPSKEFTSPVPGSSGRKCN